MNTIVTRLLVLCQVGHHLFTTPRQVVLLAEVETFHLNGMKVHMLDLALPPSPLYKALDQALPYHACRDPDELLRPLPCAQQLLGLQASYPLVGHLNSSHEWAALLHDLLSRVAPAQGTHLEAVVFSPPAPTAPEYEALSYYLDGGHLHHRLPRRLTAA